MCQELCSSTTVGRPPNGFASDPTEEQESNYRDLQVQNRASPAMLPYVVFLRCHEKLQRNEGNASQSACHGWAGYAGVCRRDEATECGRMPDGDSHEERRALKRVSVTC